MNQTIISIVIVRIKSNKQCDAIGFYSIDLFKERKKHTHIQTSKKKIF